MMSTAVSHRGAVRAGNPSATLPRLTARPPRHRERRRRCRHRRRARPRRRRPEDPAIPDSQRTPSALPEPAKAVRAGTARRPRRTAPIPRAPYDPRMPGRRHRRRPPPPLAPPAVARAPGRRDRFLLPLEPPDNPLERGCPPPKIELSRPPAGLRCLPVQVLVALDGLLGEQSRQSADGALGANTDQVLEQLGVEGLGFEGQRGGHGRYT